MIQAVDSLRHFFYLRNKTAFVFHSGGVNGDLDTFVLPMDSQLYQIDNSLLLDNSNDALNMVNAISVLTAHPACRTIKLPQVIGIFPVLRLYSKL